MGSAAVAATAAVSYRREPNLAVVSYRQKLDEMNSCYALCRSLGPPVVPPLGVCVAPTLLVLPVMVVESPRLIVSLALVAVVLVAAFRFGRMLITTVIWT